ncbi:putative amidase family protein [Amniculicola lignicola CBS 123094]|uniref:Putative amidase family protein n=1 Tax=Amniculicola lignicola CBS 123094 TaxID=1392246 RepID=A0A6A5VSF9_9PLEO|nr:putative amidase family protein [Amniculicola lignicola CBS 123094]
MSEVNVHEITVDQAHDGFRAGAFTAYDLTSAFLHRIQKLDKSGPRINSTLAISTSALKEAQGLDAYFQQHGEFKGRIHGIPILVKDQADTAEIETMYGSGACKGNIPAADAFIVHKLKSEGAIILGKTVMSEWASTWFSASSASNWEFTHNPYKLGYDVGGSSSGSAAAVAANFALLAVAEDTGGSIRCPASFTNTFGIRCTPGLISRAGFCPLVKVQDTPGPIARTVRDMALMLDCMVGFDVEDPFTGIAATAASLGLPRGGSYASTLTSGLPLAKLKGARIGVVRALFGPATDTSCAAVNSVIEVAFDTLKLEGTAFIDIDIPNLKHHMTFTPTYLQRSRSDINSFLATKPHLPQDIANIIPKEPTEEFLHFTSQMAHGPADPTTDPTYLSKILARDEFKRSLDSAIAANQLDALAFPDVQIPPPKHEDATNGRFPTCWDFPVNTLLASQARLPAVSMPVGFTADGLPVGLELVGLEYAEQSLIELARGVEILIGGRRAPLNL